MRRISEDQDINTGRNDKCKFNLIDMNRNFNNEIVRGVHLCCSTNSTMFTNCCDCAICNDEKICPKCGSLIYGYDAGTDHERGITRWKMAFKK